MTSLSPRAMMVGFPWSAASANFPSRLLASLMEQVFMSLRIMRSGSVVYPSRADLAKEANGKKAIKLWDVDSRQELRALGGQGSVVMRRRSRQAAMSLVP